MTEFEDVGRVFHPTLSPDGAYVAFGTAGEGSAEESLIHVRNPDQADSNSTLIGPGYIPRWWVADRDTFLVYATSAVDNSQARWASTRTLMQKMTAGKPVGAPSVLTSEGGYHDGISRVCGFIEHR